MLDQRVSNAMTDELWETLPVRARIPRDESGFLRNVARTPRGAQSGRSHRRALAQLRAIIRAADELLAGYVRDVSANGLGILSPTQLFPKQRVEIWMAEEEPLELVVRRCRRLDASCFECGGQFARGALSPGRLRSLVLRAESSEVQ